MSSKLAASSSSHMNLSATAAALSSQWPHRSDQVDSLLLLLSSKALVTRCVHIYGRGGTGKTALTRSVLSALKVPHSHLDLATARSDRALLSQLADDMLPYFGGAAPRVAAVAAALLDPAAPLVDGDYGDFRNHRDRQPDRVGDLIALLAAARDTATAARANARPAPPPLLCETSPFYIVIDDAQRLRRLGGSNSGGVSGSGGGAASVAPLLGSMLAQLVRLADVLAAPIGVVFISRGIWPSLGEDIGMEVRTQRQMQECASHGFIWTTGTLFVYRKQVLFNYFTLVFFLSRR